MTQIITRYFEDARAARAAKHELLYRRNFSPRILGFYDVADGLAGKLTSERVEAETATAYEDRIARSGGALLLVKADYKPLGVARIARDVMADMGGVPLEGLVEDVYYKQERRPMQSILPDHPYMLTKARDPDSDTYHMADWPIPLISRRVPFTPSAFPPHARMADKPVGLLLPGHIRFGRFPFGLLVPGHKFMANFPFGHIVPGHKFMANFPFGHIVPGHKYMAKFPFGHIVPGHKFMAKFPFGHIVPGGKRMANWPFPLLINGERHTNSLVPGQKYMAKFPFAHIVPGHKYMAKFPFGHIVPGHKFMAKFPFAHIVPGHKHMAGFPFGHIVPGHKHMANFPFGHIVPGHKYMANWILPHTKTKAA